MMRKLKWGILLACAVAAALPAGAQSAKKSFVYIQNEEGMPFYVKVKDKLLSASSAGYIIIPGLQPGTNSLVIGFPKNEYPEARFSIRIGGSQDQGFLLKKQGKHFVLYDMQDFSMIAPAKPGGAAAEDPALAASEQQPAAPAPADSGGDQQLPVDTPPAVAAAPAAQPPAGDSAPADSAPANAAPADSAPIAAAPPKEDPFGNMLNAVTGGGDTPAAPAPAASAPAATAPDESGNTSAAADSGSDAAPQAPPATGETPDLTEAGTDTSLSEPSKAERRRERRERKRQQKNEPDFITFQPGVDGSTAVEAAAAGTVAGAAAGGEPAPEVAEESGRRSGKERRRERAAAREAAMDADTTSMSAYSSLPGRNHLQVKPLLKGADSDLPYSNGVTGEMPGRNTPAEAPGMASARCAEAVTESVYEKTRKKMAGQSSAERMLKIARRAFGDGCYTSAQIQNLAYLFMDNASRYNFLELAYAHAYDPSNFSALGQVLTDDYYKNRFQALVKQ